MPCFQTELHVTFRLIHFDIAQSRTLFIRESEIIAVFPNIQDEVCPCFGVDSDVESLSLLTCPRLAADTTCESHTRGRSTCCKFLEYRCIVCSAEKGQRECAGSAGECVGEDKGKVEEPRQTRMGAEGD